MSDFSNTTPATLDLTMQQIFVSALDVNLLTTSPARWDQLSLITTTGWEGEGHVGRIRRMSVEDGVVANDGSVVTGEARDNAGWDVYRRSGKIVVQARGSEEKGVEMPDAFAARFDRLAPLTQVFARIARRIGGFGCIGGGT